MFKFTKAKVRIVYWISFVLFMIFIVLPFFSFFYLFNEDKVKQAIVEQFDSKNYYVSVEGGIVPKLLDGMSLDLNSISIFAKNGDDLLKIKNMRCKVSWLNLVIGRYRVNQVIIDGLDINQENLLKYGLGDLAKNISMRKGSILNIESLRVSGVNTIGRKSQHSIASGQISIAQEATGIKFNITIKTVDSTFFMVDGNASSINNSIAEFNTLNIRLHNKNSDMDIYSHAEYLINKKFVLSDIKGDLAFGNYKGELNIDQVEFSTIGLNLNNLSMQATFTRNLVVNHILLHASNILSDRYKWFQVKNAEVQYKANFTDETFSLDSKLENIIYTESTGIYGEHCYNKLSFTAPGLINGGLNSTLGGSCSYNSIGQYFLFDLAGEFNSSDLSLHLQIFNDKIKPYIVARGKLSDLNLSNLSDNKLKPLFSNTSKLPLEWLSWFNAKSNFSIEHFSLGGVILDNLDTDFTLNNGHLSVRKFNANAYNGLINGSLDIVKTPTGYSLSTSQIITRLRLKDMLSSYLDINAISGIANMNLVAHVDSIRTYGEIHKKINGSVLIEAKNGAFHGVDFNLFSDHGGINLSGSKSTIFDKMKAKLNFVDGISKDSQLYFSSPYVIASGGGILNFTNNTLDYSLNIKSALPRNSQKISSVVIPVSIVGDLLKPKINIQNIKLIGQSKKDKKNILRNLADNKLVPK